MTSKRSTIGQGCQKPLPISTIIFPCKGLPISVLGLLEVPLLQWAYNHPEVDRIRGIEGLWVLGFFQRS